MSANVPRAGGDGSATELLFCAICQVSIPAGEVERGEALRTPRGRTFCGVCSRSTAEERVRRQKALEVEFADDAPVPLPGPAAASAKPNRATPSRPPGTNGTPARGAGPAQSSAAAVSPASRPGPAGPPSAGDPNGSAAPRVTVAPALVNPAPPAQELVVLDARVGELERAAFRLGARLATIEEKLDALLKRLG